MFCFAWNFAMWIPTVASPPPLLLLFGLVDAGIAIGLAVASGLQSSYVPHSKVRCRQAATFQAPAGVPNFYSAAAAVNGTQSAEDVCKEYVDEWTFGVALV